MKQLIIDAEFRALIAPLAHDEYTRLESNIIQDGCRDALVLWNGIIIDGHNRYKICTEHGIVFDTVDMEFDDRYAVKCWMYDNQLGRRNLTDEYRTYLLGARNKLEKLPHGTNQHTSRSHHSDDSLKTHERIAKENNTSPATVERAEKYHDAVNLIADHSDELKDAILRGETKISKKDAIQFTGVAKKEPDLAAAAVDEVVAGNAKDFKQGVAIVRKEKRKELLDIVEDDIEDSTEQYVYGDVITVGSHVLACMDNTSDQARELMNDNSPYPLAFCDPPYNADVAEWDDGRFLWSQDHIMAYSDVVAVTPGIGNIPGFMAATKMPYKWSTSTHISNGMTRGALGFGNWMYTAIFSHESVYRNSQDICTISIRGGDYDNLGKHRQKPPMYLSWLFELFTEKGQTILDPFGGSGVSVIVADRLGRKCVCIEKDPETFSMMVARIKNSIGE